MNLQWNDLVVAGGHRDRPELQPLREVHGADRDRSGHARSAEAPAPGLRTGHASGGDSDARVT